MKPAEQAANTLEFVADALARTGGTDVEVMSIFARSCAGRIVTDGANQYYDAETGTMKFETMTAGELRRYLEEELLDAVNYAWMISHADGEDRSQLVSVLFSLWKEHCR